MKNLFLAIIILAIPALCSAQATDIDSLPRNSIVITPLGDLINNNKSSIYYTRILNLEGDRYLSVRVGTELFNVISTEFSTGVEDKSSSWNLKSGLEFGRRMGKIVLYYGPEISYTAAKVTNASLFPTDEAIFSVNSLIAQERTSLATTKLSLFSLIGFVGFKYQLTGSLSVGIESALGIGWFTSLGKYDSNSPLSTIERHKGVIADISVNRFISLEYRF